MVAETWVVTVDLDGMRQERLESGVSQGSVGEAEVK